MAVLEHMQRASFKKFEFMWLSESTTSGKKIVSHEYPNSNRRFTEELGEIPQKITMNVIVYDYYDKEKRKHREGINRRVEFENILNSEGLGELVHPFYGTIENVMATTYTSSSNLKEVGVFNFSINFEVSSTDFIHVFDVIDEKSISDDTAEVWDDIYDASADSYVEPTTVSGFAAVVESVTDALETIQTNIKNVVNPIREKAAEFNKIVNNAIGEVNDIVQSAETLKDTFSSVYTSVLNLVDTPSKLESFWNSLLSYESILGIPTSTIFDRNTSIRIEKANNVSIIQEQVRLIALAAIYESIAYKESKTVNEINNDKEFLNEQYNIIINDNIDNYEENNLILLINNMDVKNSFTTLKNNTIEVLNNKLINAWKVSSIDPHLNSFSLLSYKYYNNIDNIDTLINLNEDLNSSGFRHSVDILISE